MLDANLAQLYGVSTARLNQQVRRNAQRFPPDFMIQLTREEKEEVVASCNNLHNLRFYRGLPLAFTEHGAIMVASVLNTEQAVRVSVFVVRAFVKLREMLANHKQLAQKLEELELRLQTHDGEIKDHKRQIQDIFEAIRELMEPPPDPPRKPIGFLSELEDDEPAPKSTKTNGNNRRKLSARHPGRR